MTEKSITIKYNKKYYYLYCYHAPKNMLTTFVSHQKGLYITMYILHTHIINVVHIDPIFCKT